MSRVSKPVSVSSLSDAILGCFRHVKPSETLDHLVRYLGTWSGSDKLFTVLQYTLKLVAPFLRLRARLQYRAGLRPTTDSIGASGLEKFAGIIGDSRTLWRMWGLLPIFQWLISLERSPPATRTLLVIERLQGWSMLAYYPLEHLSYLVSHGVIPATFTSPLSARKINLSAGKLSLWSCRFWALYVFLHIAHLIEDRKLLLQRQRALKKSKVNGLTVEEKVEIHNRWDAFWSEVVINLGNLPLTIHWSLENGLFQNEAWPILLNLTVGITGFRSGWRATALPSQPASFSDEKAEDNASI